MNNKLTCGSCGQRIQSIGDLVSSFCYQYGKEQGFKGHRIVLQGDAKNGRVEFKDSEGKVTVIKIKMFATMVQNIYSRAVGETVSMENGLIKINKGV